MQRGERVVPDATKVIGLVFSRDRAMQLDACLRSFERQIQDSSTTRFVVLFRASTPRHQRQYDELARTFAEKADFIAEHSFRKQVLSLLHAADRSAAIRARVPLRRLFRASAVGTPDLGPGEDCLLFLVDDTLFVRPFSLTTMRQALLGDPDALGVSLRLGKNTTRSYVQDNVQPLPDFRSAGEGLLAFDWTKAAGDFGYPLEVSSSLYRLDAMRSMLTTMAFDDPNALESKLSLQSRRFSRRQRVLLCPTISLAFSAPLNRVQTVFENRTGSDPTLSQEALADRFENGERIDVAAVDGFVPQSCHQEIELKFTLRGVPDGS